MQTRGNIAHENLWFQREATGESGFLLGINSAGVGEEGPERGQSVARWGITVVRVVGAAAGTARVVGEADSSVDGVRASYRRLRLESLKLRAQLATQSRLAYHLTVYAERHHATCPACTLVPAY